MASITSAQTGLWSASATWTGGVVPVIGDNVTIAAGHIVTVDGTFGCGDDTSAALNLNGTLKASRTVSSQLTVRGDIRYGTTGIIDYGKYTDRIPSGVSALLLLNDSATLANGKWGIRNVTGSVFGGFHICGQEKTRITKTVGALASAGTSFSVNDAAGWLVGDILMFAPPDADPSKIAYRFIQSISGTNITTTAGAAYSYPAETYVVNLTRNVAIRPSNRLYSPTILLSFPASQPADTITFGDAEIVAAFSGTNGSGVSFAAGVVIATSPVVNADNVNPFTGPLRTVMSVLSPSGQLQTIGNPLIQLAGFRCVANPVDVRLICTQNGTSTVQAALRFGNGIYCLCNDLVLIGVSRGVGEESNKGIVYRGIKILGARSLAFYRTNAVSTTVIDSEI